MKMPSRQFYPPIEIPPDIFGLKRLSLLSSETETERATRVATVERGVAAAFKAVVEHLGEDAARQLFASLLRRPKRGPGKALAPDRDARLLIEHDAAAQAGETVAALARRLHKSGPKLGNTPEAIATQIRRLVKKRKERDRAAAVQARQRRMATRGETSLLSQAPTGDK
jgi:hypothetical protein